MQANGLGQASWADVTAALPCGVCGLSINGERRAMAVAEPGGPLVPVHESCLIDCPGGAIRELGKTFPGAAPKAGDCVLLRSGGPLMTAVCEEEGWLLCAWYDEEAGKIRRAWLTPAALTVKVEG